MSVTTTAGFRPRGVVYTLAGAVDEAAAVSVNHAVSPTVNARIDYPAPATRVELSAETSLVRNGDGVATVEVTDNEGTTVAAKGVTWREDDATE